MIIALTVLPILLHFREYVLGAEDIVDGFTFSPDPDEISVANLVLRLRQLYS